MPQYLHQISRCRPSIQFVRLWKCSHLADELAAERVDDAGHRRLVTLANEVKVQHALDCSWLQTTVAIVSARCRCCPTILGSVLTRRSIVSCCGRECALLADSSACLELQSGGCCR